ncbi:hypothetical protein CL633_02325 [bacterium]|nr:hypothetical protein [bacterium]|tara:strand:- start:3654 stop:5852 length:2199 start_codon:yes stop_codon:yes gene_type:complete
MSKKFCSLQKNIGLIGLVVFFSMVNGLVFSGGAGVIESKPAETFGFREISLEELNEILPEKVDLPKYAFPEKEILDAANVVDDKEISALLKEFAIGNTQKEAHNVASDRSRKAKKAGDWKKSLIISLQQGWFNSAVEAAKKLGYDQLAQICSKIWLWKMSTSHDEWLADIVRSGAEHGASEEDRQKFAQHYVRAMMLDRAEHYDIYGVLKRGVWTAKSVGLEELAEKYAQYYIDRAWQENDLQELWDIHGDTYDLIKKRIDYQELIKAFWENENPGMVLEMLRWLEDEIQPPATMQEIFSLKVEQRIEAGDKRVINDIPIQIQELYPKSKVAERLYPILEQKDELEDALEVAEAVQDWRRCIKYAVNLLAVYSADIPEKFSKHYAPELKGLVVANKIGDYRHLLIIDYHLESEDEYGPYCALKQAQYLEEIPQAYQDKLGKTALAWNMRTQEKHRIDEEIEFSAFLNRDQLKQAVEYRLNALLKAHEIEKAIQLVKTHQDTGIALSQETALKTLQTRVQKGSSYDSFIALLLMDSFGWNPENLADAYFERLPELLKIAQEQDADRPYFANAWKGFVLARAISLAIWFERPEAEIQDLENQMLELAKWVGGDYGGWSIVGFSPLAEMTRFAQLRPKILASAFRIAAVTGAYNSTRQIVYDSPYIKKAGHYCEISPDVLEEKYSDVLQEKLADIDQAVEDMVSNKSRFFGLEGPWVDIDWENRKLSFPSIPNLW